MLERKRIRAMSQRSGSVSGSAKRASRAVIGRDFEALRQRRMQAARMFDRGARQVDVARELDVSAQTASRWYRAWQDGGRRALTGAGRAGRPPRLSDGQLRLVEKALLRGPRVHGYATDMWTLARVAEVIEKVTGVRYAPTQTWTILRQRLGWSRQRPARRAVERDEEAIRQWVAREWPRIERGPAGGGPGSSSRTRAGSPSFPR
jgi:transposase